MLKKNASKSNAGDVEAGVSPKSNSDKEQEKIRSTRTWAGSNGTSMADSAKKSSGRRFLFIIRRKGISLLGSSGFLFAFLSQPLVWLSRPYGDPLCRATSSRLCFLNELTYLTTIWLILVKLPSLWLRLTFINYFGNGFHP